MKHYLPNSLRALFLFLAVLLSLPMLAQKLNLKEARLIDNVRELSLKEGQGNITVPAPARHVVNYLAMKTPSRTENINPYEAMAGEWTMTTASGKKWNVTVHAAAEDDPDYNNVLYVTGMMGYDWTVLTMPYSYNYEEGKPEVYIKAGELFAEGVNFTGLGVCNVYLYNIDGSSLALNDMVAEVSADGKTLDFGANSFYGAVLTSSNQYAGRWFNETGVKMTQKSGIKLNGIYYSLNAETKQAAVIANSSGWYSGDVVIPESVEFKCISHSVTSIGEGAFSGCSGLTSVTIPNSVKSIGDEAFLECSGLTSVTIPNSVTSIGYGAFFGCSGLTSVTIGNSVTSIGDYAFRGCSGLTSVTIPNSVTSIGSYAFEYCSGLTSVTIPNSVTSIGSSAFYACSGLTSVTIPNSVTSIGEYAFQNCSGLTSVHISDIAAWCNIIFDNYETNPLYYAEHLYLNGEEVKDLVIPNSVTSIGDYAFDGCSGLTSVTIPNSVKSIGREAFDGCSGLTSVTIGTGVESIGKYAFNKCSGLTSVTIGNSVTIIGYGAFKGCTELLNVYCYAENVPSTESNVFNGIDGEKATLHVPAASIESYKAKSPWSSFKNIVAISTEVDGINYNFDAETHQATVIAKSSGMYSGEIVIPESVEYGGTTYSVTSIGSSAFEECSGLSSVTIPNSVTSIGEWAFFSCSGLTSVTIPNSVTSIGNYAFNNCSGLTSATIPNSVTSIGIAAFAYCTDLTLVTIPNSVTSIGDNAFEGCSGLTSVTIPNSVTSIGNYAFLFCSGLTSVTIGNSVESIGNAAFSYCSGLTSVTIPNSVESIGEGAFCDCSGLTSVTIPNSVTSIGHVAFSNCSDLTSVTIGNGVTSIGSEAFSDCSKLLDVYCYAEKVPSTYSNAFNGSYPENATLHVPAASIESYKAKSPWSSFGKIISLSTEVDGINYDFNAEAKQATVIAKSSGEYSGVVVIPESVEYGGIAYSVTSIGESAFKECTGLTSVTIPYSVTSIGEEAFYYCYRLTSVTIPNSVTSIGDKAFYNCSGLTSVSIPNSVTSIGEWAFFDCDGLTSVTIPNSVTSIGNKAFYSCDGLTSITIPNSVESIGNGAFSCCSGLASIVVEEGNPVYDSRNNCNAIIETATNTLHSGCKTTTIPNIVTSIGYGAFEGCIDLTSVTIPNSVTSIGECAFGSCSGLTSVTIPNSVKSIGDYAFQFCSGLTSVTIPNSVESIGYEAFSLCSGLTSITIPNSVTYIANSAFRSCEVLASIVVDEGNPYYDSRNNCNAIIETATNDLIVGCKSTEIPYSVESIGTWAFTDCFGLTSITIPNSVTYIGFMAFSGCSGLTSITIPNSVTSLGYRAFGDCSDLTSVTIGNGVTSIGEKAFVNCPELHDVYCYAEKVPSTESNAFDGSYPENATLHVPAASINSYKARAPWNGFENIVAISESTSDLVIKDGESFENTEERELGTLTYTRTLPNRYWNPLYVPFKIPYEALKDNYDVAYINSMHSYDNDQNGEIDKMTMEVILVKNGVLKANHPYLIRAKSENDTKMELVLEDVTLYPTVSNMLDCSSVYTRFEITGTYKRMTRDDLDGSLVITTSGAWMELSESSELKPFRFYLTITDRPGSPLEVSKESKSRINICVQGEDDFSTGIEETEIGNVKSENSAVYDLSGRRVQKAQKGIFIRDGKVVVR